MKHEWRKAEKGIYLPKNKPEIVNVPAFKYFTIEGEGNPNADAFSDYIGVLYAASYATKMGLKKGNQPLGYCDYTVYPLEGVWDINDEAKKTFNGTINKDDLVFKLMIRQPNFVEVPFAEQIIAHCQNKKADRLFTKLRFETITEGKCIQMLHLGSYDNEPASFKIMEDFALSEGLSRLSKVHKEIYLSDARKVAPEKLKTVLRFKLQS